MSVSCSMHMVPETFRCTLSCNQDEKAVAKSNGMIAEIKKIVRIIGSVFLVSELLSSNSVLINISSGTMSLRTANSFTDAHHNSKFLMCRSTGPSKYDELTPSAIASI